MIHIEKRHTRGDIMLLVDQEFTRAVQLHAPMVSYHEGHSVMWEEFEELWNEIRQKRPANAKLVEEAVQVAAMACRFVYDLCEKP